MLSPEMRTRIPIGFLPLFPTKGGECWGEAGRLHGLAPLLDPLPTRSSRGEEEACALPHRLLQQQRADGVGRVLGGGWNV